MKMHAYRLILKARVSRRVFFFFLINVSDTYTRLLFFAHIDYLLFIFLNPLKVSLYNKINNLISKNTHDLYLSAVAGASAFACFFTSSVIVMFANCTPTVNQWAI